MANFGTFSHHTAQGDISNVKIHYNVFSKPAKCAFISLLCMSMHAFLLQVGCMQYIIISMATHYWHLYHVHHSRLLRFILCHWIYLWHDSARIQQHISIEGIGYQVFKVPGPRKIAHLFLYNYFRLCASLRSF